jgi:L-alanine-DL-glutamate epimerase-like enolase superfamily enzyme
VKLILRQVQMPLRHVFRIAHGVTEVQRSVIVELREGGVSGYGESAPLAYYNVTADSIRQDLEAARGPIEAAAFEDPAEFWQRMRPHFEGKMFALCGLDEAAHDLWGKRLGKPVYRLWGLGADRAPLSNYTIGIDTVEKMVAKMKEFDGWPIYKIKLGTDDDLRIVRELRRHTGAIFRVDANCAWTADQAVANSRELKTMGVEFIEQPLPRDDWTGMERVCRESALPVIADESCITEDDVPRCAGRFHGINVKLVKAGGLTPARRMLLDARRRGLKTMVGCMTESTVGISAIAQLLGMLDYVDMDGAALLASDVATGVRVEKGRAIFPAENGCGVRLTVP